MKRSPLGSNRNNSYHPKYINQSIAFPSWWCCRRCRNSSIIIFEPVPFEEAPALLVQPRRTTLSALRTVTCHITTFLLLLRQVPSTEFTSHESYSLFSRHPSCTPNPFFISSLPTLCKRMTPSCATTALGVMVLSFSQEKRRTTKMHHDGEKKSN